MTDDLETQRALLQRDQVLRGVAEALAAKGYAAVTIADIAAAARASRSTVYAQFPDKVAALLALHDRMRDRLLQALGDAHAQVPRDAGWHAHVAALVEAYLEAMASASEGERLSLVEVASAGPEARQARQAGLDRFAGAVARISAELAAAHPGAAPLEPPIALSAVAAFNELVMRAAPEGPDAVRALAPIATELLERLSRMSPQAD